LRALGYELGPVVFDPLQRVNLVMATHRDLPAVEVIAPAGDDGPLASLLRKDAELVYHVCFATADREATLEALKRAGVRVLPVLGPTPAVLFGGRSVSFHRVAGFGLIELVSSEVGP
jgi:methylmalonyl-CoA/ethylmalonyl-CoA epimerase